MSYLLNQLQPLPFRSPVVVTLNPVDGAPDTQLGCYDYAHLLLDLAAGCAASPADAARAAQYVVRGSVDGLRVP